MKKTFLIVEARFYPDMSDALAEGAIAAIEKAGANYERVEVAGVLEIPAAIRNASHIMREAKRQNGSSSNIRNTIFDAYIALGVVIRGETSHYETVCNESARGLMDLGIKHRVIIGNGIQTVENEAQAWARCKMSEKDKGGGAARAALSLLDANEKINKIVFNRDESASQLR